MKDVITIDNLLGALAWLFWISCAVGMVTFIAVCLHIIKVAIFG